MRRRKIPAPVSFHCQLPFERRAARVAHLERKQVEAMWHHLATKAPAGILHLQRGKNVRGAKQPNEEKREQTHETPVTLAKAPAKRQPHDSKFSVSEGRGERNAEGRIAHD